MTYYWSILLVCLLFAPSTTAWFDCNWPYRSEVTITENSGTNLTDYQVRLDLSTSTLSSDYTFTNDGGDLRILDSDDATPLSFFIDSWDPVAETAVVWVQFALLTASADRVIYLYYGNNSAPSSSTEITFVDPGIKFHTRNTSANPGNKTQAFNSFNMASDGVAGYGCTFITNFTGVNNRNQFSPPSRNNEFGALSESFFEVQAGEEGIWSFRYGADFGRGGGLYVNDIALEEQWTDDLWWAFDWTRADDVLEGSISLTEGFHKLEVIGFEGCCDGGITVQYRRPGGVYQTFETSTIDVRSRKCPVVEPSVAYAAATSLLPQFGISKNIVVVEDPINGVINPKSIIGSRIRYNMTVTNTGLGTGDEDSIEIIDTIPDGLSLYVSGVSPFGFSDGAVSSSLTFDYVSLSDLTDDVAFSDDRAVTFDYIPSVGGGADDEVTHIRITPSGRMTCGDGTLIPSFSTFFDVIVD